ncbi:MAG: hypothetical protein ACI4V7_03075 [Succinivibrionaceae bacterium]
MWSEEKCQEYVLGKIKVWFDNHYEDFSDYKFDTTENQIKCMIIYIKHLLNKKYGYNLPINYSVNTKLYYAIKETFVLNIDEKDRLDYLYIVQALLRIRGYSCDFCGTLTDFTKKALIQAEQDSQSGFRLKRYTTYGVHTLIYLLCDGFKWPGSKSCYKEIEKERKVV